MLIGQYVSRLTDKNRISVPKKIREELGEEMIIAKWYEGCLVLVSKENWQKLIKRLIGEAKLIISPVRDIDRFVFASAFEADLDGQGRFVVPESLINYSGIKDEVVFVGGRFRRCLVFVLSHQRLPCPDRLADTRVSVEPAVRFRARDYSGREALRN